MLDAAEQMLYVQSGGGDGTPGTRASIGKSAFED